VKGLLGVALLALAAVACNPFAAKIYSIPPCALDHWDSMSLAFPHNRWETEFSFKTSGSHEDIVMIAPVNLPNGVTVKKVVAYVLDNTPRDEARMMIILGRHNFRTGAREQMGNRAGGGNSANPAIAEFTLSPINFAKIDNENYSYYLIAIFGMQDPNLKFHGAKIYYR